jgi:hypothetical protein
MLIRELGKYYHWFGTLVNRRVALLRYTTLTVGREKSLYESLSDQILPSSDIEDGRDEKPWQQVYWQNDQAAARRCQPLHNSHNIFREWAATLDLLRQRKWPESYAFMVVDKDVLDEITWKS